LTVFIKIASDELGMKGHLKMYTTFANCWRTNCEFEMKNINQSLFLL